MWNCPLELELELELELVLELELELELVLAAVLCWELPGHWGSQQGTVLFCFRCWNILIQVLNSTATGTVLFCFRY